MATKMIGFRLSGDHLEKAQEILGNDITAINKKAQEQINQINQETTSRLNNLENKIITANTVNRLLTDC